MEIDSTPTENVEMESRVYSVLLYRKIWSGVHMIDLWSTVVFSDFNHEFDANE